ncbi:MAG: 6-phosphofructokinase [Deltaproteobacteria bacterium]|nr:6-phosphofructokinase [Deltaproteobacteria bacterium]
MKRIGVMTSGGDSSGMNAALRAVVRTALDHEVEVFGFLRGYSGVINKKYEVMDSKSVSGVIQRGGTILRSARCEEFKTDEGQERAVGNLRELGIDGVVVIGGDGSLRGANALSKKGIPVIGIPASIDNDIFGTDMSIGADSALNVIVDAVDMLKDTASSHDRAFIIEVMGRNCGYLAAMAAIACGAEVAIIPEITFDLDKIAERLYARYKEGRTNSIVLVAEGAASAYKIDEQLKGRIGYETRITVLGHLQRGGSPTVFDRILASRLGRNAVESLLQGESGKMVGQVRNRIVLTDLEEVLGTCKMVDLEMIELTDILGR